MRKPGLFLFFIANITFNYASVSWGKNAAYCETTQVLEIDEHALSTTKSNTKILPKPTACVGQSYEEGCELTATIEFLMQI